MILMVKYGEPSPMFLGEMPMILMALFATPWSRSDGALGLFRRPEKIASSPATNGGSVEVQTISHKGF